MRKTYIVDVTSQIAVTLNIEKFDDAFMAEFSESFFAFDTIEQHAEHIAQLFARGIVEDGEFIEGYGEPEEMGISCEEDNVEYRVVSTVDA